MPKWAERYVSAAVGIVLLGFVVFFINTMILNIVFAVLGIIIVYEANMAFFKKINLFAFISSSLFISFGVFFLLYDISIIMLLIFMLFCNMMFSKEKIEFHKTVSLFMITFLVYFSFLSLINLRDLGNNVSDMRILVLIGLGFGWVCDSMAYTFGKAFGKRKLCPKISPNKTVEGAVYGVIVSTLIFIIIYFFIVKNASVNSIFYRKGTLNGYTFIALASLIGSVIGILGDLSFSFIKRECGIKDYSNIMPGHGGALDRFDSVLFTLVYASFVFSFIFMRI